MEYIHAFGQCATEKGIMVVFSCRKESSAMKACIDTYVKEQEEK